MAQPQQDVFFGSDFGQKVDLTARIREILRNYPEGTSIFKELIQNADDAGAKEVRLVLDERTHATEALASPVLASLQGPALLCWNDAQFSEVDFQSIQRIGDSLKKEESRGAKTGRFGVGFNSVYHVTEVPTFVSGRYVVMFDPQAAYLPNVNPANPGKIIDFLQHRQVLEAYPDQFRPLRAFGCDVLAPSPTAFPATLFRFPLRTPAQAEASRLSKQAHPAPAMRAQLEAFAKEAAGLLLFLKSVERLSVWIWPAAGAGGGVQDDGPTKVAEAHVRNMTEELRRQRNFVARTIAAAGAGAKGAAPPSFTQQPVGCEYVLETAASVLPPFAPAGEQTTTETWIVCNRLGGGRAGAIAAAREYQHMKLIPWAGVAGRVAVATSSMGPGKDVEGLAYCFLPLPVPTQLPVHVNGYFELSSNRRDIWQGDDMVGDGALRAAWNRSLLCEIVVPCYTRLLQLAAQRCGPGPVYDALWPVRAGGPAWAELLDAFFVAAAPLPLLHTELLAAASRGGRWGGPGGGNRGMEGQWVAARDAVVIPPEARQLQQEQGEQGSDTASLDRVLLQEGLAVLKTSRPQLEEALVTRKVAPRVATPEFVRAHFRASPEQQPQQQQHPALKDKAGVLLLLRYCVSDLSDHSFTALDGLPLLPAAEAGAPPRTIVLYSVPEGSPAVQQLTGMGFPLGVALRALSLHPPAKVGASGADAALAWILERQAAAEKAGEPFGLGDLALGALDPNEELALFRRLAARLVDFPQLPDKARAILQAPRFQKASNVRSLAPALLPTVLRYAVPLAWQDAVRVPWSAEAGGGGGSSKGDEPDLRWFLALWQYLLGKMNDDLRSLAEGVPFLPCNEACVVRLSPKLPVLLQPASSSPLVPALLAALRKLGVLTVHEALVAEVGEARLGAALRAFVQPARRSGVLAALRLLSLDPRFGGADAQERLERFSGALASALGPEAKDALRTLLLAEPLAELTQEELALVKALPVFRAYGREGTYVSLLPAAPLYLLEGIPPATLQPLKGLLSPQFLRAEDPLEPALLKRLGTRPLSKAAFLLEHFFPAFPTHPPALRSKAMLELVLADLSAVAQADARMLPALRELPFLPTAGEQQQPQQQQRLARCMDLYDPEVEELTALVGAELFPHPDFAAPETLALLRQLGLRSTLRFDDVVRIARSTQAVYEEAAVASVSVSGKPTGRPTDATAAAERASGALGRARMLFRFVNENAERFFTPVRESAEAAALRRKSVGGIFSRALSLFDEQARAAERTRQLQLEQEERERQGMVEALKEICWVPVLAEPPLPFLPWWQPPHAAPGLVTPSRARLHEDLWYASARFGIVAQDTYVAELVKAAYGWRTPLAPAVVAQQLVAIAAAFHDYSSSSAAAAAAAATPEQPGAGGDNGPSSVQAMQQQVASVVPVVYQMLSGVRDAQGQADIRQALSGAPWVFVGDRFVQAEQVAFAAQVNATPYLYSVPADLACFAPLLKAHGVRPAFGAGDFVQVLQAMALETGATGGKGRGSGSEARPLTAQQLELAIALVQRISDESMMVADWEIYVPDDAGLLARSSELVYDDAPWLSKMQNRADIRFAHPKISSVTGDKLGIRSVRRLLMESHADEMDFGLPTEAFGQSEALTRRLRHILELYPEGPSILSELIQNADDAGASTVRVLYSSRHYGTTALLGSKMAPWQGPALYVYNDSHFSQQDFQNIARIGQASKLDKVLSTGRFGLGFNATYHCTDLPSFVSAEHLVIFDPHVRHLPGATRQQPGIKIRFVDTDLLGQFPDQFEPYTLFGCTLRESFPGTLFRFPVRTPELARESEISKSCYDAGTVKELFASFQAAISRYLLFLRHVDNIEVYVAHDPASSSEDGSPQLLYRASRSMDDRAAWHQVSAFMTGPPSAPLSKEAFYAKLGSTPAAHLPRVKELVSVAYQEGVVGFEGRPLRARRRRVDEFMVCAGLGGGAALSMAVDPNHSHLKFIPFGGVAAHINTQEGTLDVASAITDGASSGGGGDPLLRLALGPARLVDTTAAKRGQAFCFLPLPVDSGLPVLINGYFELSSNRRDIWQGSDMSGEGALRSAWNQALLQDVVAPLYAQLVQEMALLLTPPAEPGAVAAPRPPLRFFYSLFPIPEATQRHFAVVGTRFYELTAPRAVLWSEIRGGSWAPAQTAMLVDMEEDEAEEGEQAPPAPTRGAGERADAARLREVLLARGCCIVPVPPPLKRVLVAEQCCHNEVSPPLVRQLVREAKGVAYQQQQRGRAGSSFEPWPATQEDAQLLLVYCASDLVERGDVSELDGLPLLPLADGALGTFAIVGLQQGLTTYFIVGEAERPLFAHGQHVLVLERERLLPKVAALLENADLMKPTNVVRFAPPHLDAFLQEVLPAPFADALEVACRPGEAVGGRVIPDAEWVRRFWSYLASARGMSASGPSSSTKPPSSSSSSPLRLLSRGGAAGSSAPPSAAAAVDSGGAGSNCTLLDVSRVCGRWPLLPVLRGREKAPMLVRLDAALPLLHMSHTSLPVLSTINGGPQALEERLEAALTALGIRVVDRDALPEAAEPLLAAPESQALVHGLTTLGLLATLRKLCPDGQLGRVAPLFAEVGPSGRRALRALLGSARHMDAVRRETRDAGQLEALVQALRCLPVYESYEGSAMSEAEQRARAAAALGGSSASSSPSRAPAIVAFCALAAWPDHWLPPEGVDPRLLDTGGPTFLRSAGIEDAQLLEFVGVRPIPLPAFYQKYVLEALAGLGPEVRLAAVGKLLADIPKLKQADAAFVETLKGAAFVPNGGSDGELKRPGELHDPLQGGLTGLLEPDAFPAPELCTPEAVTRLRVLGLRATLSLAGVLASAASVEALATAGNREGAVRRGKDLLRFLDHHLEELAEEEQGDGSGMVEEEGTEPGGAGRQQRGRLPLAFVQGLRRHAWVPISQAPPHPSLPWPATAMPSVIPPTGTRPQADMWLCSLRRGIAELDVSSPCLREALGWEDPLDATTLAYQLVGLSGGFQAGRGGSYRQILSKTVPEIYEGLQQQVVDPIERALREEHAAVPRILAGASWIWVGDEFLPTTRVAFLAPPNSRPYLVQVPPELEKFAPMLCVLGVRESFTVPDLARALQTLHEGSSGPLPSLDLQQAVGLLRALQKTPFEERQEALRADVAIYAPAEDGTMHRIDTLCYNDAPWLLATVEGRVDLTFVHKDLPNDVARALGARSLREALLANQCAMAAIPCARAEDIHAVLTPLTSALAASEEPEGVAGELALRAVLDVLELADEVGCRRVDVLADGRTHGAESLLHPLLASAQGPALLIHLHDVVIGLDDLIRLASPTRLKNGPLTRPYPPRGPQSQQPLQQRRSGSLGRSRTGSEDDKGQRDASYAWPVSGLGLSSLFHLTDLVQVLSGDTFVLFDPAAQFLVSEATVDHDGAATTAGAEPGATPSPSPPPAVTAAAVGTAGGEPQPVARRYTMSMGQRLHERFPHQFAPFASLGAAWTEAAAAGDFAFRGTVIRCPLRRQGGALSPVVAPSVEALPLARLLESVPPSLLFSLSLEEVGVATWGAGAAEAEPLASARLVETTPAGMRQFRRELVENREWRKNKLLTQLFKGNAPAPLSIHVAEVACAARGGEPYSDQWLLLDALAHGASRDAALSEPLKTTLGGQSILPLVSVAARLESKAQGGSVAPSATALLGPTGRAFSVVDTGSVLGLPCHVNAPFFLCDALVPALGENLARGRARRDFHFAGLAAAGANLIASGGRLRGEGADDLDRLARWNKALLSTLHDEVLPALLTTLRDLIVQAQGDGRGLYTHWPHAEHVPERFKALMRTSGLGDRLATGPYFWARRPREPPAFVKLGEAFFFDSRKWGAGGGEGRLAAFLGRLFPLFDVPGAVLEELRARNAPVKEVTPSLLRRHLRAQAQTQASVAAVAGPIAHALAREVAGTPGLALDLLRFCLGDCGPQQAQTDGLGACRVRWRELAGLPLLPLEDGTVSAIAAGGSSNSTTQSILADVEQRALLPHLKHRFVAAPAARFLLEDLKLAVLPDALAALGIVRFGPDILAANVHTILPPAWKGLVRVPVDWAQVAAPLSPLWLYRFWRQVPLGLAEELFAPWPLVPASGCTELVNCALASHVLRLLPDDLNARLQSQLEAEEAREAAAAVAAGGAPTEGQQDGPVNGRRSIQGGRSSSDVRPGSAVAELSPRAICLDVKEVDLLHQQVQAALAPTAAAPRPDDEEDGVEDLPLVVAGTVADDADDETLLPVAAEVARHEDGGAHVPVTGIVVAAAGSAAAASNDDGEDAEVGTATAAATTTAAPIVSDGAARLAAALTAPERERRQELLKALKKARAPVLELAFFPREAHALLTVTEPREVTHAVIASLYTFKESVQLTAGSAGGLSGEELDQLLRRLTSSSTGGGAGQLPVALTASEMEKLKQLAFFETLGGERVSIAEGGPYLVLDDRDAGRDRFLDELLALLEASASHGPEVTAVSSSASSSSSMSRSKVLKRKPALDDLYKDLGVAALKKSDILSRFLVPSLPTLDRALRGRVLELLRQRWASENLAADATLVAALKETPFLERPNGELASPSELLDPRSDVLREVFEEDPGVFPQGDFATPQWLAILGTLGLQSRANEDVMVEAAKRLEAFASLSPLPFAVACKAAKLVRHFVGDNELSVDKSLLKKLAPIRFVPVERPGLHMTGPGPDTGAAAESGGGGAAASGWRRGASAATAAAIMTPNRQYQLVAFAEAAPAKDRHLVWTVVPVLLPTHVPPQLAWSALGIVSPPSKERVVQHLVNLCSDTGDGGGGRGGGSANGSAGDGGGCVLDRWVFAEPPVSVFQSLFQYLQEQWIGLPPATQALLKDLPCIPVGNRLVRPSRLFFRLAQDLAPFLFEVPRAFGAYDRLLRDGMGVRAVPAVQDYARLLAELKQECSESPLNPNELEAVVKVVCLLADTTAERDEGGMAGGSSARQDPLRRWELYAPDDRAVLVPLETCLYDDASWLRGRVHAHLLRVVHPRIGLEACRAFGIPRISQVVRECLAPDFLPEPVSALDRQPVHGDPALLAATLTSAEFAHALACLFAQRDATWGHMSRQLELASAGSAASASASEGGGEGSAASFNSTTLRVEEMAAAVHRALRGFRVDFVRALRSRFLRRVAGGREEDITSQPEGSMFHVDAEERAILLAVNLLPPSVTTAYVLAMAVAQVFALGGAGGGEWVVAPMSALLATHPPANVRQVMALLRLDARDEARAQHLRRGMPGQLLQEGDRARVEFRPLRVHMQGEIVAWQERPDAPLRYGTVVLSGAGAEAEDDAAKAAGAGAGGVVRRLLVRVGPGKVQEMLSTQVYSFKNTKASDAGSSGGRLAAPPSSSSSLALRSPVLQHKAAEQSPAAALPAAVTAASTAAEGKGAAAAVALAPVESAQLLTAVDDILSRVNLSLGEEPKAVMERNMRLQRDLEAACREAEGAREQALGLAAQLDQIKAAFQCQVCVERDVDQILAPCGHLLCGTCRESVQTTCPFCRERIRFIFPFYKPFSS